ncbi:MAG: hypothetical protein AB1634_11225 [Thermodesulfobacteriota bacterium]
MAVLSRAEAVFDAVEAAVSSHRGHRLAGAALVSGFLAALLAIELGRRGLLPARLGRLVPDSHLAAIQFAFTLLLVLEVVGLILTLARSISTSVGKQFEVLSLILLRDVFKELAHLEEPVRWPETVPHLPAMGASAVGALVIFVTLGLFYRAQCRKPITQDRGEQTSFIAGKKLIALGLLAAFAGIMARGLAAVLTGGQVPATFESLYTLLIFTDVLLVLLAIRYSSSYHVAFRNSGFAVATVMIRLALIAPPVVGAALGAATAFFALAVTVAYNRFAPLMSGPCEPAATRRP